MSCATYNWKGLRRTSRAVAGPVRPTPRKRSKGPLSPARNKAFASEGPVCAFNCTNEKQWNLVYSFHPGAGGVGHVRWLGHMLSENISLITLIRLFTYRERQPVTDSF